GSNPFPMLPLRRALVLTKDVVHGLDAWVAPLRSRFAGKGFGCLLCCVEPCLERGFLYGLGTINAVEVAFIRKGQRREQLLVFERALAGARSQANIVLAV